MLSVRPTGAALGAEITGVDLSRELDEGSFRRIVDALHEHEVIFFRDQELTPEQHIAFSRRFGELEHHVRTDRCRPGYPELFVVSNDRVMLEKIVSPRGSPFSTGTSRA